MQMGNPWIYMYPNGLKDILMFMKNKYGNPPVYITENGMCRNNVFLQFITTTSNRSGCDELTKRGLSVLADYKTSVYIFFSLDFYTKGFYLFGTSLLMKENVGNI
jgi:hypothetical protein